MKKTEYNNTLVFIVDVKANKHQIKQAMKKLGDIDVVDETLSEFGALVESNTQSRVVFSQHPENTMLHLQVLSFKWEMTLGIIFQEASQDS
ncbi:60S ribosomal protein L23a-like protein [Cricetulus griseus]|uniref:60S ribosomal protein L23a-like protein n=1 Tax=Cricetulus griseus TaxID=10029 RepID=A0A061IJF7_CRIGR|nr:60S ribosomal protein L23a-like protein [Cricetulus griseus]